MTNREKENKRMAEMSDEDFSKYAEEKEKQNTVANKSSKKEEKTDKIIKLKKNFSITRLANYPNGTKFETPEGDIVGRRGAMRYLHHSKPWYNRSLWDEATYEDAKSVARAKAKGWIRDKNATA